MKRQGFSIIISFGKYGGFYYLNRYMIRICIGWVALTYMPEDFDDFINKAKYEQNQRRGITGNNQGIC
jgi:hypothetical protein